MGQSQSTRRGTPSYRRAQSMGQSRMGGSDESEVVAANTLPEGLTNSQDSAINKNNEKIQNEIKRNIPIVTVTGKLRKSF